MGRDQSAHRGPMGAALDLGHQNRCQSPFYSLGGHRNAPYEPCHPIQCTADCPRARGFQLPKRTSAPKNPLLGKVGEKPGPENHELASYSITSSAVARRVAGIERLSVFAVLRLMTSSYLVGACTGRCAKLGSENRATVTSVRMVNSRKSIHHLRDSLDDL